MVGRQRTRTIRIKDRILKVYTYTLDVSTLISQAQVFIIPVAAVNYKIVIQQRFQNDNYFSILNLKILRAIALWY